MFESPRTPNTPTAGPAPGVLTSLLDLLPTMDTAGLDEADLIDVLATAEAAKNALSGLQARAAVALDAAVRTRHLAEGLPAEKAGAGVHTQVALARSESPHAGHRLVGMAQAVVNEMPHAHHSLATGRLSEWRATLLVQETACLDAEQRRQVDEQLLADPSVLEGVGTRALVARARKLAYAASPSAVVDRARRAVKDRRVSLRPAPDTMSILSGLLPVAQGVSVLKALTMEADRLVGIGDGRSRGQIMADTLVERLTGRASAAAVPVAIQLVMTDRTLFQGDGEPAFLPGYGVIPAQVARDLIRRAGGLRTPGTSTGGADDLPAPQQLAWLRRLYTAPETGELVAMDSRTRIFPAGLARFIETRDQCCRSPWCDAPVRHHDHVLGWAAGGRTTAANSAGLCAECNYSKEAPGWRTETVTGARHTTVVTTPTGHHYRSQAPPLPGDTS
ncbi:HNH endonuclease [Arthrobacter sp. AOP36-C1-22]|uniref:HNH endonuclease n=1 Tax=Arthrobacter sp. AOP36-C1-22 TaxID=3457683 RepID=UPI0040345E33